MSLLPLPEKSQRFLLILLLLGFVLSPLCIQKYWQPYYFGSGNSYSLDLETDAPLTNATFLVPLPVQNGFPAIGFLNLTEGMFNKPGYNCSIVSFEGNWYLRITADSIHPIPGKQEYQVYFGDRSERIEYTPRGYQVEYDDAEEYPYWINTRQPLGNETVFLPKYNVSVLEPATRSYTTGRGTYFNPVVLRYQTKIYAEFDSQNATSVNIYANLRGHNTWVERFQGSEGNWYSDSFQGHFSRSPSYPSPDRWYLENGEMKSGSGRYLDGTY